MDSPIAVKTFRQPATFVYMGEGIGIAELQQNLSLYLRQVRAGERLVITDQGHPIAELGPPPMVGSALDRLVAEGRVKPPKRASLPEPLPAGKDPEAGTRALEEVRGYR